MPETLSFCVPAEADGERLDKWLSGQESLAMTRSALQVRMEHGDVTVNGKKVPKNYRQKAGDQVLVQLPEPEPLELQPENIPLDIVYEDDDLLVVNIRLPDTRQERWYMHYCIIAEIGFPASMA